MANNGSSGYGTNDKLKKVQNQADEVKLVLQENINKTIARGEAIEIVADKALRIEAESRKFEGASRKLKCQQLWNSYKMYLLLFIVVVVFIIILLALGGAFK